MDRLRKELMAKGDIPIHEVFNTIWEQPIVNICEVEEQQPCEDCISRTKAIEMLGDEPENWTDTEKEIQEVNDYRWFKSILESLPSVTPQAESEE